MITLKGKEEAAIAAEDVPIEQQRADAIGLVAESALSGGLDSGSRGDRYQVVVHVDSPALEDSALEETEKAESPGESHLQDGPHVSAETSRRLACDSSRITMRHSEDGTILDVGRKTRAIPPAIQRALNHRDQGCRFPGCGLEHCDAHHIKHWADGGETKVENLAKLCKYHHRAVHEGGIRIEVQEDRSFRFYWPSGRPLPQVGPVPTLNGEPCRWLKDRLAKDGLEINSNTGYPYWDGGSFDMGWAMDNSRPGCGPS